MEKNFRISFYKKNKREVLFEVMKIILNASLFLGAVILTGTFFNIFVIEVINETYFRI